jgi:hypothetical protein
VKDIREDFAILWKSRRERQSEKQIEREMFSHTAREELQEAAVDW